jgi:hypothetical protein
MLWVPEVSLPTPGHKYFLLVGVYLARGTAIHFGLMFGNRYQVDQSLRSGDVYPVRPHLHRTGAGTPALPSYQGVGVGEYAWGHAGSGPGSVHFVQRTLGLQAFGFSSEIWP